MTLHQRWNAIPFPLQVLAIAGVVVIAIPWVLKYWSWVLP